VLAVHQTLIQAVCRAYEQRGGIHKHFDIHKLSADLRQTLPLSCFMSYGIADRYGICDDMDTVRAAVRIVKRGCN
jgi:hypothetical protein